MALLTTILIVLTTGIPFVYYLRSKKGITQRKRALITNLGMFAVSMVTLTVCMFSGTPALAEGAMAAKNSSLGLICIAAGISTGMATIGAGIAVGSAASAALGALSENEKIFGKSLIFVALAEGIALYGVLVSVLILGQAG